MNPDPIPLLQRAALLLRDGEVSAARALLARSDAPLNDPATASEAACRARLALASAVVALASGDGDRAEDKLAEAFRLLGLDD